MKSKFIATSSVFAALTVALNLWSPKIPAPFLPFLYYQIWEIPIVAAFLLYGPLLGIAVSIINTLVLFAYFPGELPTGPIYNLLAVLGMLLGVYVVQRFLAGPSHRQRESVTVAISTALGVASRVAIMSIVNWAFIRYPPPIGYGIPEDLIIAWLPFIGLFNATLALYTIPMGYVLAKAVSRGVRTEMQNLRSSKQLKTKEPKVDSEVSPQ
jgi:riboflavin transporter FmnP